MPPIEKPLFTNQTSGITSDRLRRRIQSTGSSVSGEIRAAVSSLSTQIMPAFVRLNTFHNPPSDPSDLTYCGKQLRQTPMPADSCFSTDVLYKSRYPHIGHCGQMQSPSTCVIVDGGSADGRIDNVPRPSHGSHINRASPANPIHECRRAGAIPSWTPGISPPKSTVQSSEPETF